MGRKLALFFDGTWSSYGDETNVSRLFELTKSIRQFRGQNSLLGKKLVEGKSGEDENVEQIKYYHKGVGVNWGEKLLGGAFGRGLSRNIKDGYLWLASHYRQGDEIYIFGFSRGAYTARSLAGLIRKCGIPKTAFEALAQEAYHIYREKKWDPDGREAKAFWETFSWPDRRIKFLGVWDTVGALGIPIRGMLFSSDYYNWHDTELSRMVENAYHALALDEHRHDYAATMWSNNKKPLPKQKVEQRWFPGAHADVGGGYKGGKLYQIPLQWMQQKAEECGLQFKEQVVIEPDAYLDKIHNSLNDFIFGIYAKLKCLYPCYYRPLKFGVNETIDDSVWNRMESPNGYDETGKKYSPPALIKVHPNKTSEDIHPAEQV